MKIPNPQQIKEFFNLPPIIDEQCELCTKTANHYVITRAGYEFLVCEKHFTIVLSVEAMLQLSN
jgi:hypothetical protein